MYSDKARHAPMNHSKFVLVIFDKKIFCFIDSILDVPRSIYICCQLNNIWRPPRKSGLTPKTTKARILRNVII